MYITLDEDKVQMIIQALKSYSHDYRVGAANAKTEGYRESTAKEMLQTSVDANDLCEYFEKQVNEQHARRARRTETQTVDPYEVNWPINDPRKW